MKQQKIKVLLTMLMSMMGVVGFAHDIAVANADGKTIYYTYVNNSTELAVSYRGSYYYDYSNEYSGNLIIPETVTYDGKTYSVTSIGSSAFYECSGLESITIPNSVTSIGSSAFYGCSGLTGVHIFDLAAWCNIEFNSNPLSYAHHLYLDGKEIKDLVIPNSVTSIGNSAFSGYSALTSITIPNSVTSIGHEAFSGCTGLTDITIPNSVTNIGGSAFSWCINLTSITIPNSVTSVGRYAYYETAWYDNQPDGVVYVGKVAYNYKGKITYHTNIVLEEGTLGIADGAFSGCSGLKSIIIPYSVTSIGENSFSGCSDLMSINIPYSVTRIGNSAFSGCSGLTSITIPYSVTRIGNSAFSGCSGLTSITIPNTVVSIGGSAFQDCSSLTSITIPNSVASIGSSAFLGCSGLTQITIGNSVTTIGGSSFGNCPKLTDVYCLATNVPSTGDNVFQNSNINNAKLHVPKSAIESYHETAPWNGFKKIVSSDEVEINGIDVTNYLQNPGFDEDLTWKVDGSTKDIIDKSVSLSNRSFAWRATDNSVYASAKTADSDNWKRTDVDYSWNGFIGHIQGWSVESNKMVQPPYNTTGKTPEWVYFGSVPYGLNPSTIPIADDNNGSFLNVPDKPAADLGDNNKGVLFLRAGWGARAVYKQVVSLPCAVYRIDFWVYNNNYENSKYNSSLKNLCKVCCRLDEFTDDKGFNAQDWTLHSIEFTPTSSFTIELGYESAGNSVNNPFLFIDGVKLYKIGEADPIKLLKSDFVKAAAICDELIGDALAIDYEGLANEISEYKSKIEEMGEGDNQTELDAHLTDVNIRIKAFRQAIIEVDNVNNMLKKMDNLLKNTDYTGKVALQTVYDKVKAYQKNTAGTENLYIQIIEATAECDAAIKAYILSQEASEEHPADFTYYIQHPWFIDYQAEPILKDGEWVFPLRIDENGNDRYIKGSKNSPDLNSTGWHIAGASGGEQRVNWQCIRSCWNAWKSNYTTTIAVAQDIEGLPNGYYTVSADMITGSGSANGTQRVFAQSSVEKKTSTKALESEGYDYTEWETVAMTADDKVLVVDGKLTVGAEGKGDGNASAGWFMVTNFHLYYLGPNPSESKKITIGSSRVATFCTAGDVDFSTLNLKAYTGGGFNRQTGVLTMMRVYDVPAGTGLLLKGEPGTYFVPYSQSYSVYVNLLKGVTEATNVNATEGSYVNYVLNNGSQGVGFYKVGAAGASLEAGHAYLQIPAEAASSRSALKLRFDDEDEATGIDDSLMNSEIVNSAVYDLQGRRVEQPQPGLYIRNGKKVIIK
mgnify:CR=1 FL=1